MPSQENGGEPGMQGKAGDVEAEVSWVTLDHGSVSSDCGEYSQPRTAGQRMEKAGERNTSQRCRGKKAGSSESRDANKAGTVAGNEDDSSPEVS